MLGLLKMKTQCALHMNFPSTPRSNKGKIVVANWENVAAGLGWKDAAVLTCKMLW